MSTKIQWTEETWNPVTGCSKVSQGCKNCYAETIANRFWGERKFTDVRCHEGRLETPLHWKRPRRIFVNSMSDLFHEDVPFEFIDKVFSAMFRCPQHTFQILTKRTQRMIEYCKRSPILAGDALPNVWLGVSVEDQATADERIPLLLQTPAAVRWVSYEPALEAVNFGLLGTTLKEWGMGYSGIYEHLDWLVIGGESGPKARPFNIAWARSAIKQFKDAGVAVFMKQCGSNPYDSISEYGDPKGDMLFFQSRKGGDMNEWPEDLRIREFPKG